jgi:hypothetical protein
VLVSGPLTAAAVAATVRSVDARCNESAITLLRRARHAGYAIQQSWLCAEFDRISPAVMRHSGLTDLLTTSVLDLDPDSVSDSQTAGRSLSPTNDRTSRLTPIAHCWVVPFFWTMQLMRVWAERVPGPTLPRPAWPPASAGAPSG